MFYNINTSEVEDFTGMGLQDVKAKLIRTPLKAVDTFMDDPLRMIRSVRFAHRFGFTIHEEIVQAAQN
jgi:tRNA nucleotidyltransferase (CCA-adding enzyme)